ncbi:MAG TPA: sigma-70 family RNA polymerase sigma factor [Blastocatellia bacterium]|nr:sigma-70 family RNA polymerase sigma factor [Blastocatellia bacterium]
MDKSSDNEVTQFLIAWRNGDETAFDTLIPVVYKELHQLAKYYLSKERPDHTLQASALVNEAYLRLIDYKKVQWENRVHFFAVAGRAMRRVLIDHARSRKYAKRGGAMRKVSLDEAAMLSEDRAADLIALDDALTELFAVAPRKVRVVELMYFVGLTIEQTAEVLGVSTTTVSREWKSAKTWLHRAISRSESHGSGALATTR